jgi:nitroreductase
MNPDDLEALIHRRASGMTIDRAREVPRDVIERIVNAAVAAPNHRKTRPLRVAVLQGESRLGFGEAVASVMSAQGEDENRVEKARTKYGRAPVVLAVASAPGESDLWSSPVKGAEEEMNGFCGFPTGSRMIGLIYLGHGTRETPPRDRPAPEINWLG